MAHLPDKPEDDDYFYLRWLRAQKFDTTKAEVMLKKVGLHVCTPEWQYLDSTWYMHANRIRHGVYKRYLHVEMIQCSKAGVRGLL